MGRQPVIIGVGEIGDPVGENLQDAKTIVDLMSAAADAAILDTGAAAEPI